jgi:hypothetical protein
VCDFSFDTFFHGRLCDARFGMYAIGRKICKRLSDEKSQSRYISRLSGERSHPLDCDGSSHILEVTNIINLANFWRLYVNGFGFCEGMNFFFFLIES